MLLTLLATLASATEVTWVGGGHGSNPQWSADGAWLAFEVNNNADKVDLYVVKVQNGNPGTPVKVVIPGGSSSFAAAGTYAANPVWHPKQDILIFEAANAGGTTRLYYLNPGTASPAEYLNINQAPGNLSWPAISVDGGTVAFTSSATGTGDIYLFSQSTNKVVPAYPSTNESENAPRFTMFASLVFSRKNFGTEDIFSAPLASPQQSPLKGATGAGDQSRPHPTMTDVVYFTNERGDDHWDIAAVPLGGGDRRIVAKDVRLPQRSAPSLSADNSAILYTSADPTKDGSVYEVRLDGTGGVKEYKTGMNAVGDPTVVATGGRTFLAFTALPATGSDWRQLHVVDVTGTL